MDTKEYIQGLIDRARTAQQEFETYSQEQVDKAVRGIGKIIYDNGEMYIAALDQSSTGNLWPGDLILLDTQELFDGKLVK